MAKRKRKVTRKQLAALAKGRAKRKTARKPTRRKSHKQVRQVSQEPIIIMKGDNMAGRKRRKTRRKTGRKITRRKIRFYGADKYGIQSLVMQGAGVTAGAVAGSMVARMIPIADLRLKSLVPIVLGAGIVSTKAGKKGIVKDAALGSVAIGIISLVKTLAPQLPFLAADESDLALVGYDEEEQAMLGLPYQGEDEDEIEGEDDSEYYGIPIGEEYDYYGQDTGVSPADL